ncbi:MAG: proline dehydrogenase family protein [Angustibacter sp.]
MIREALLRMSRSGRVRQLMETAPMSRALVRRFVAGTQVADAVRITRELTTSHRLVTIDRLGGDVVELAQARVTRDAYVGLLDRLRAVGATQDGQVEVSVKLSSVGQALGPDGEKIALEHAWDICRAASEAGTTVTLDMEDHATADSTLSVLRELREDYSWVGAVLQSCLRRAEADCRDLAGAGSRVRLCKGAYDEPESVAFQDRASIDRSYVRCAKVLMQGQGYPMLATHDPRLVDVVGALAVHAGREQGSYEYQMLFGVRPDEQLRLARAGERVRVYLPYGEQWYGYLMRRMAERPANAAFLLRAVASSG